MDGITEERRGTISVFNGPQPTIKSFDTEEEEFEEVGQWLNNLVEEGITPEAIGIFVRSSAELPRAIYTIETAGLGPPHGLGSD